MSGGAIALPGGTKALKMAGTVGVLIGGAPNRIAGYIAVNDVSIPHESYYRPAISQRCRDGFCVIGSQMTASVPAEFRTFVNDELRCRAPIADLLRPIDRLIADIGEFLTLQPGDIVLIGEAPDSPLAQAGDRVRVEVDGLPALENHIVAEVAPTEFAPAEVAPE
jgi:5-oxopent-3-ene-1,2,5-tricarboxylate decarboxylase/2-hydroxyhepta-2,4-diene-1,7-dioate isomerase